MPHRLIVVSDSMAKYVRIDRADILPYRGARIADINYHIKKEKGSISSYRYIILHVGTNDVFKLSYDKFMAAYCGLISLAKSLFPGAVIGMSAILPRPCDFQYSNVEIREVNKGLSDMCHRMGVRYFHSYRYFLKGGKPLRYLFSNSDALHLNYEGTRLLGLYFKRRVAHFPR